MKTGWVYILKCSDESYYTGSTSAIDTRIAQHELGTHDGYTASRRPVQLVWTEQFPDMSQAVALERQIKRWTRKKKEALIRGDFDALHYLSACGNETHYENSARRRHGERSPAKAQRRAGSRTMSLGNQ
jgi:predicted GIY-YIG superfamily endonuclease